MTLEQLIETDMVKDDTTIIVSKPLTTYGMELTRRGNWYQDQILDFSDSTISKLTYIKAENKIYIELEDAS